MLNPTYKSYKSFFNFIYSTLMIGLRAYTVGTVDSHKVASTDTVKLKNLLRHMLTSTNDV